jgi:GcrA cell cycle regulator
MATPHHHNSEDAPWFTKQGMTARLIALHSDGVSRSAIARILGNEFGLPVTKNQVIGKVRRLKLPKPPRSEPRPKLLRQARPAKPRKLRNNKPPIRQSYDCFGPRASIPLPPPTSPLLPLLPAVRLPRDAWRVENLPIVALKSSECQFAYGEAPYQFCGRPRVDGFPYCRAHLEVVYRPREEWR